MEAVAKLWEEYRPKLAEAREKDTRDLQRSLVSSPERVGNAWIVPLTLGRFLYLDAISHPFLTGDSATRDQVLDYLWIMSPEFKPGNLKAAKRFFRRFWFRRVKADALREFLAEEFAADARAESKAPDPTWIPRLVDVLANEYGWSEREIFDLPLRRLHLYSGAMVARRSDNPVSWSTPHADRVRNEFFKEANKDKKTETPEEKETVKTE